MPDQVGTQMNRQQRRSIMRRLRSFMESISGKKFDTLMESFINGMSTILEADSEFGLMGNDFGDTHHVFAGLMKRSKSIKERVDNLIKLEKLLGKPFTSMTEEDFTGDIDEAIEFIEDETETAINKGTNEAVDDDTKSKINEKIEKINGIVKKVNDKFSKLGGIANAKNPNDKKTKDNNFYIDTKISNIDDVNTFGELKNRLVEIKSKFSEIGSKYDSIRSEAIGRSRGVVTSNKEGSVKVPEVYKRDIEVLLNDMKNIESYKETLSEIEKKGNITELNKDAASIMLDELESMSKPYVGTTIKDDDFAAATMLFYSIAAKKGDLQIQNTDIKGAKNSEPGTPRENLVLALYVLLGKTALKMKRWIIGRAPGIDWQTFETNFKFELIGRSMKDVGASNLNVRDLPPELPKRSMFIKAVPGGTWNSELDNNDVDDEDVEQEGEENAEKTKTNGRPNKNDFIAGGLTEEELVKKYGGWIEKNGEYYVPVNKKSIDGTGNLVDDMDITGIYDEEGYLTAERKEKFGKGEGTLEICYNISDFVPEDYITAAEDKYDNSIKLARLILKSEGPEKNDNKEMSSSEIVEKDMGCTALCIFYWYMVNESNGILENFKMPLYNFAAKSIYNIVRELQAKAVKKAPRDAYSMNIPFDDLGGGKQPKWSYEQEKVFDAPGRDIPITVGKNGIQKLPEKYGRLLDEVYDWCILNKDLIDPVGSYFDTYGKDKNKKIEMYQDILKTAGLPAIMKDDDGNVVYNSREKDLYEAYSFFNKVLLLTDEEVDTLEKFVNGELVVGSDQNADSTLESAIKKINEIIGSDEAIINAYNKRMSTDQKSFDLEDIVNKYNEMKKAAGSDITVNGIGIGTKNEGYIVHEIESVASKDVSGILRPLLEKLNTIENGVPVRINPPENSFGIGANNSFKTDVVIFGNASHEELLNKGIVNEKMATLDGSKDIKGDVEGFPPVQNYRDMYSDAMKNTMTYASVVSQIYSLLVYLSEQNVHPRFKVKNITHSHNPLSNKLSDELQFHLTERVCEYLKSNADISGNIAIAGSGIRDFLDYVIEPDSDKNDPAGMNSLRDAYDRLVLMLSTEDSEANWKAGGYLKDLEVNDGKESPSEKEFRGFKETIASMVERMQSMVSELSEIKNSRKAENITYGDLIYFMLYGGLGLTTAEKNERSGGSYYDAFLDLVTNYGELKKASERISMDVCGENNERVANMAAAVLLLMLSTANDLTLKHYKVIENYEDTMENIDSKIEETEKEMENAESGEDSKSSMTELMEKYDELTIAKRTERKKMIGRLKKTIIGTAEEIVKNDFKAVVGNIIKRVKVIDGYMDIESMVDLGGLMLAAVSRRPDQRTADLGEVISSSDFSKSNKYIETLKKKSAVNKALTDIVSGKAIFNEDNELAQYYDEYRLALARSGDEDELARFTDIKDELGVITNDQIKDALIGKGGLFTDEYVMSGSKSDPIDRAEAACRAIVFNLMKQAGMLKDIDEDAVSINDFNEMMKSILKDNDKRSKLVKKLEELYAADEIGSIKTFVNAIKSSFGMDKWHKYATAVLVSLVNDAGIPSQDESDESQPLPEEFAKVALIGILNLTDMEGLHTDNDMDYDDFIRWLAPRRKHINDAVKRIQVSNSETRESIIKIASVFSRAVGEDNPLRRNLYHMCSEILPKLLNKVINYESANVEDDIIDCIKEVFGEDISDEHIFKDSGILDGSEKINDEAVSRMADSILSSAAGDRVLYNEISEIDYDIKNPDSALNYAINLKKFISRKDSDLGEIINTWEKLINAVISEIKNR